MLLDSGNCLQEVYLHDEDDAKKKCQQLLWQRYLENRKMSHRFRKTVAAFIHRRHGKQDGMIISGNPSVHRPCQILLQYLDSKLLSMRMATLHISSPFSSISSKRTTYAKNFYLSRHELSNRHD